MHHPVATHLSKQCGPAICIVVLCKQTNQTARIGLQAMLPIRRCIQMHMKQTKQITTLRTIVCLVSTRVSVCEQKHACSDTKVNFLGLSDGNSIDSSRMMSRYRRFGTVFKSTSISKSVKIFFALHFSVISIFIRIKKFSINSNSSTTLKCFFRFENSNRIVCTAGNHILGVAPIAAVHLVLVADQIEERCLRTEWEMKS